MPALYWTHMTAQQGSLKGNRRRLQVGAWTVDADSGLLTQGDTSVRVRPKVMDLLVALAERPGELSSKEFLIARVWPDVVVGDGSLSVALAELRNALGNHPEAPEYIETIPRRGYRLTATMSTDEGKDAHTEGSHFWLTGAGLELELLQGENIIGRSPDAYVRIESPRVSRLHARITVEGDSAVIEDMGSKNGTFVGNTRVDGPIPLVHGDQIRLGQLAAILSVAVADRQSTLTELSRDFGTGPSAES